MEHAGRSEYSAMTRTGTHRCVPSSGTGQLSLTLVRRIRTAYRTAIAGYSERQSDLWSYIATRTSDIHEALISEDEDRLANLLSDPGSNNLFYGFDNLNIDTTQALIRSGDGAPAWAAELAAMIAKLAESVAAKRIWQPEFGTTYPYYEQSQSRDMESLLRAIERGIGYGLTFPTPFPNEYGVATSRGIVSHRAVHAIYYASRLSMLRPRGRGCSILEIGAGMGRTALYAHEWGLGQYTIVDLPMSNVAQAAFLGAVLGEDAICLTGENRSGIRILTPEWLFATDDRFDIILNTDSLTEMPLETATRYAQIAMDRAGKLLSINHEANDVLVHELAPLRGRSLYRSTFWLRPEYVEELFVAVASGHEGGGRRSLNRVANARADFEVTLEQLADAQWRAEALGSDLAAARDDLQQRTRALSAEHLQLEESTRRTAALERELQAILTSHSWRLTAPLRRFRETLLGRTFRFLASALVNMRRRVRERATRRRNYALIVESGLFDASWYRERYPDVASAGIDPLVHYLTAGGFEGRVPHPDFDGAFYLASNPDVAAAGVNPLVHYVTAGRAEGRAAFAPGKPADDYEAFRLQALARRRGQYPLQQEPGLFSLLTTVWNTPPEYLDALADSVLGQDADSTFEWVLLDNGSHDPGTRRAIERLAKERAIRMFRVEDNLGIVGGMRFCLERATDRYVLPVDSDDLLTPDCLRVVSHALRQAGYPVLAYTDEDKLEGSRFSQPYFKSAFDPVLFTNSCYTAHLGAIDRKLALEFGAYTDPRAEGSHDWDTFTRFLAAGHTPLHIPEVLYSWRIHQASTSGGNAQAKPFVYDSQRWVLTKMLETLAPTGRFRVERPPRFVGMPDWWIRRDATAPRAVTTVVLASSLDRPPRLEVPKEIPHEVVHLDPADGVAGLARVAARAAESGRLLHILWHDTRIVDDVWALEAIGLFELFPDTAMVGGRLHQNGRIVDAGAYFGFGRGCDAPDRGQLFDESGAPRPGMEAAFGQRRPIRPLRARLSVCRSTRSARSSRCGTSLGQLGAWLGAAARRQERRVIYTPFLSAMPAVDRAGDVPAVLRRAFRTAHGDLMPDALLWPPHVGLTRGRPFRSIGPDAASRRSGGGGRNAFPRSGARGRSAGARRPAAGLLGGVVLDPDERLRPHASTVLRTDRALAPRAAPCRLRMDRARERPGTRRRRAVLDRIAADPRVQRFACTENAGIQGAMRQCLARAARRFVVPLDADDVLEPDALEVLAAAIDREQADFVFSDEDHLTDERVHTPYSRPGFDPVLNLESSYIWHLCAFSRERALELGVYSNQGAEYCHDWDTIVRFSEAGLRIAHVPHVLYHWRTHAESQSNTDTQNPGSLASMRAVVEAVLARRGAAERYEIAEFPLFRGAVEWWIRRRPIGDPSFAVVVLGATQADVDALAHVPGFSIASHVVPLQRRLDTLADWRTLGDALPRNVERIALLDLRMSSDQRRSGYGRRRNGSSSSRTRRSWAAASWMIATSSSTPALASPRGETMALYQGLHRTDAGAFALALKPQTIEAPAEGFLVVERRFLEAAIESVTREGFTRRLGATLGALAKAQHRRVIYSPLVEARRIRIPRDMRRGRRHVPRREDSRSRRGPNDGAPAVPALRLIAPTDWQHVGTRPEFKVRTRDDEARGEVLLFGRDDYVERGIERAARVASVRLEPAGVAGVLVGMPATPLPEGDYIVVLKESTGGVLSVSGVCIRDAKERWPRRFQAMLEEQARFAVAKPAFERPRREGEPLFSIATAIHDVDPSFLVALADSILGQRYDDFEWVLLDNGSHRPDTQQVSRDLAARDPRVRFWRVEDNLHIIGGSRFLLERARGTYIVPVDHDDVLYPDALRILSSFVAEHHEPDRPVFGRAEDHIERGGVGDRVEAGLVEPRGAVDVSGVAS